jgi:hypothetical protein
MVVQIQRNGRNVTGLNIGSANVRRYFPKKRQNIDIHLGHLLIRCELQPAFWLDEPSIADPRLSLWLESRDPEPKWRTARTQVSLVPAEGDAFRLEFAELQPIDNALAIDAA